MTAANADRAILDFWFEECSPKQWFTTDDEFDRLLRDRFLAVVEEGLGGGLAGWGATPEGNLALILCLDQFTRNIFRETAKAFAGDAQALAASEAGTARGDLDGFAVMEKRQFMLMPMMHSENIAVQDRSLPLFKRYTTQHAYDYAVSHRDIVARFGRFPHRNATLGRESTAEETEFLQGPNSSF